MVEGLGIKQENVILSLPPYTEQSAFCVKNEVEQDQNLGNKLEERKRDVRRPQGLSICRRKASFGDGVVLSYGMSQCDRKTAGGLRG